MNAETAQIHPQACFKLGLFLFFYYCFGSRGTITTYLILGHLDCFLQVDDKAFWWHFSDPTFARSERL
jgi:hypothetical protein